MLGRNLLCIPVVLLVATEPSRADDQETRNTLARGNIEYRQSHFTEALQLYDKAIEGNASYAPAHNNRGLALHKLGRLEEAIAALKRAIEIDSNRAALHLNLGKLHAVTGDYAAALLSLQQARKTDPSLAAVAYNEIWIREAQGQLGTARDALNGLQSMAQRPPGADLLAAIVRTRLGDPEGPSAFSDPAQPWGWLGEVNRSLVLGGASDMPPKARATLRRAAMAFSCEQFAEARQLLAVVTVECPESPLPLWLTAMAWQTAGQNDPAQAAMKRAEPLLPVLRVDRAERPTVVFLDGQLVGRTPVRTTALPGVHGVCVVARGETGYLLASRCWNFLPAETYGLPPGGSFPFLRQDNLPIPAHLTDDQRQRVEQQLAGP